MRRRGIASTTFSVISVSLGLLAERPFQLGIRSLQFAVLWSRHYFLTGGARGRLSKGASLALADN
jgi:hypothetical protein